ncbi:MAG: hypothetical protein DSZ23_01175 [Thermodesulfatator sp.]|nr:MAG: hypothetical protein DSZ23_01175 [Thermodesulfatator sp.]
MCQKKPSVFKATGRIQVFQEKATFICRIIRNLPRKACIFQGEAFPVCARRLGTTISFKIHQQPLWGLHTLSGYITRQSYKLKCG